jgi:aryl-alcohol dehydrogenase-like predicted oxidoreductase
MSASARRAPILVWSSATPPDNLDVFHRFTPIIDPVGKSRGRGDTHLLIGRVVQENAEVHLMRSSLSPLGVGCWSFGGGDYWGPANQAEINAVVRFAVDHGCNYFDTAEMYNNGGSESSLGQALRGIDRNKVIIGSKINPSNVQPQTLVEHCEASLRRLQTDYLDLYMVHWPITPHSIRHFTNEAIPTPSVPDAFATLMRLKQQGKIRHIGVSNFGRATLDEALATGAEIVVNQLPYSLLARAIELEILPYCSGKGIGVIGYMALWQGVLSGTYPTLDDIPIQQRRTRHFDSRRTPLIRHGLPGAEAQTTQALEAIRSIAQANGLTMAQIALKWAVAGEGIVCSLCGTRSVKKIQENLQVAASPLPSEVIAELNRATQPLLEALGPSFDYWEHPDNDRTR